ncbi:Siderophore iron transporter 3 [Leucoagaricus sp. SymC.cos]|nr:Siderophore iron transporter 3 [Leucoagaricus sp. SymC.cos]
MSSLHEKDIESIPSSHSSEDAVHLGVHWHTIEATHRSRCSPLSSYSLIPYLGLGLAAYICSLGGTTAHTYLAFAASSFGHHSLLSTVQAAQSIIVAIGKPAIGKIASVRVRGSVHVIVFHSSWRWDYSDCYSHERNVFLGSIKNETFNKLIGCHILEFMNKLDIFGLMLLGASIALILLPLPLAINASHHWKTGTPCSTIAMIVVGACLIPFYGLWDIKVAEYAVIPKRLILNRSVVLASLISAFDSVSFYISFTCFFSFAIVVKPWSLPNATYFSQTQTVTLTVFGILAGICMCFTQRYKYVLIIGPAIRLLGCGLMTRSHGPNVSDAEIVWSQLLQGIRGGFASVASQVSTQASIPSRGSS